jgi:hypothetical protein
LVSRQAAQHGEDQIVKPIRIGHRQRDALPHANPGDEHGNEPRRSVRICKLRHRIADAGVPLRVEVREAGCNIIIVTGRRSGVHLEQAILAILFGKYEIDASIEIGGCHFEGR